MDPQISAKVTRTPPTWPDHATRAFPSDTLCPPPSSAGTSASAAACWGAAAAASSTAPGRQRLRLGALSANADADGLICLACLAGEVACLLRALPAADPASASSGGGRDERTSEAEAGELASAPSRYFSAQSGGASAAEEAAVVEAESEVADAAAAAAKQRGSAKSLLALDVEVASATLALPLAPESQFAVEVEGICAWFGQPLGHAASEPAAGVQQQQHSLRTCSARLCINGRPVMCLEGIDATLRRAPLGARLPLRPLPALDGGAMPSAAADTPETAKNAALVATAPPEQQDAGLGPYRRAGLQAWLPERGSSGDGGSPTAAAAAAAAEALGAGPTAVLDANLVRFELCVPHDQEPGPTERLAELYFKALGQVGVGAVCGGGGGVCVCVCWGGGAYLLRLQKLHRALAQFFTVCLVCIAGGARPTAQLEVAPAQRRRERRRERRRGGCRDGGTPRCCASFPAADQPRCPGRPPALRASPA